MHSLSLLDHALLLIGVAVECMILFMICWVPIAKNMVMMRVYLLFSLLRSAVLIFFMRYIEQGHRQVYAISQIAGHIILLLFAVEIMGVILAGPRRVLGIFYSLSLALMIFVAVSMMGLPTSIGELAFFIQKAVAAALFVLMFVGAMHPTWRWPYFGWAVGLAIMLILDMTCTILQRWSLAHDLRHYAIVHYSFPIASIIGYLIWLATCFHPVGISGVPRRQAFKDLLTSVKMMEEHDEALTDYLEK